MALHGGHRLCDTARAPRDGGTTGDRPQSPPGPTPLGRLPAPLLPGAADWRLPPGSDPLHNLTQGVEPGYVGGLTPGQTPASRSAAAVDGPACRSAGPNHARMPGYRPGAQAPSPQPRPSGEGTLDRRECRSR